MTDVWQARKERIVPLPARTRDQDGEVHVSLYMPPAQAHPAIASPAPIPDAPAPTALGEPARVAQWKNALLDLSLRNRLLNYRPASGLPIALPERMPRRGRRPAAPRHRRRCCAPPTTSPPSTANAASAPAASYRTRNSPTCSAARHTVYAEVTDAAYKAKLRGLAHKARTIVEETGANNLYLALGTLAWELDGRALRSPLILVPVILKTAAHHRYRVYLDESGTSTPNYCLVEKLRQVFGLDIPGLSNPVQDNAGIDLDATLQATRTALAEHGLRFRVEPTADLTVLQFAKFRLWKDLDESWPVFAANPLVRHLISTPTDAFLDPVVSELIPDLEGLGEDCPVPADATQLRAVAEAVDGRTFVLEGPPGTGKSQTITNLLAHAVANGKRVLFVAEKRAALDVVLKRLDQIGMGPLTLDLHDKASSPVAVREQLKQALEHTVVTDQVGMAATLDDLHSARRDLIRYTYKLHDANSAGLSLYGAQEAVLARRDGVDRPADPTRIARVDQPTDSLDPPACPVPPAARHRLSRATAPRPPVGLRHRRAGVDPAADLPVARRFDDALRRLAGEPALRTVLAAALVPEDLRVLATLLADGTPLAVLDEVADARLAREGGRGARRDRRLHHRRASRPRPGRTRVPRPAARRHPRGGGRGGGSRVLRQEEAVARGARPAAPVRPGAEVPPKKVVELTTALLAIADRGAAAGREGQRDARCRDPRRLEPVRRRAGRTPG